MKASALIMQSADGKLLAVASEKNSELMALASSIRKSGKHEGADVKGGIILAHDRPFPVMQFKCEPKAKAKAKS